MPAGSKTRLESYTTYRYYGEERTEDRSRPVTSQDHLDEERLLEGHGIEEAATQEEEEICSPPGGLS